MTVTVGIAIADASLSAEVSRALESSDVSVVASGRNVAELRRESPGDKPEVIVSALEPDGEQMERDANGSSASADEPSLVVIAPSGKVRSTRKALAHGADGFVVEDALQRTLVPTIHAVAAGQLCLPRDERQGINRRPLSYRERQALGMVVMGFSNGEIAGRMYLAESTVKSHLSSAFRKLGVRSRAEATALVLDPNEGVGVGILTIPDTDGRHRLTAAAKGR
jgi:DNA-binding NarL/FixJ family response regulator